jgi:hypothetical protein
MGARGLKYFQKCPGFEQNHAEANKRDKKRRMLILSSPFILMVEDRERCMLHENIQHDFKL